MAAITAATRLLLGAWLAYGASISPSPAAAPLLSFSYPAAPARLGSLLRETMISDENGFLELRNSVPRDVLRSLQAVERLDLEDERDRLALGPLVQHLPADFEAQIDAYLKNPEPRRARAIADLITAAYGKSSHEVASKVSEHRLDVLQAAGEGAVPLSRLQALAGELDRYDLYGPPVWTVANDLRATALALKNASSLRSAEETARLMLSRAEQAKKPQAQAQPVPAQNEPAAAQAGKPQTMPGPPAVQKGWLARLLPSRRPNPAFAAATPVKPEAPETGPVTPQAIAEAVFKKYNQNTCELVSEDGWLLIRLKQKDAPPGEKNIFSVQEKLTPEGRVLVNTNANDRTYIRQVLAAAGLVLPTMVGKENELNLGAHEIDPVRFAQEEAELKALELRWPIEWDETLSAIESAFLPAHVDEVARAELKRIKGLNSKTDTAEYHKGSVYIKRLLKIPWRRKTDDRLDLKEARRVLEENQYGLQKVKDRVVEFLAVRKRKRNAKGAVLCFTGPPGVGKTAVAKSIAQALGRKFVRLSLGGVHNEVELRGHSRTYVDSQPGSIIHQLMAVGTRNPVMLLDEIDKIGQNGGGSKDVEAALLEIFDPEQNGTFRDHYLNLPFDLSDVFFIATANELGKISKPLRDRMEIIEFPSYTPLEKMAIADLYLVPQQYAENALTPEEMALSFSALEKIIEGYTRESGVRQLRQRIDEVMRKVVALIEEGKASAPGALEADDIRRILGPEPFSLGTLIANGLGKGTGLGVDNHGGGVTLGVEVIATPGAGRVNLRRQFKDMAGDAAQNAVAYVKTTANPLGIPQDAFLSQDIDVAVTPAHDVDGSSGGVLLAVAIASRLSERPVRQGVAMTGELSLSGQVLPIGGLAEKIMAAYRRGLYQVIYPAANQNEIETIAAEVRSQLKLVPVSTAPEVFEQALANKKNAPGL